MRPRYASPFRATFSQDPIFDALNELKPGHFSYAAIRAWEIELMLKLQMTESQYSAMPIQERARMVAGMQLPGWREALEGARAAAEARRRSG